MTTPIRPPADPPPLGQAMSVFGILIGASALLFGPVAGLIGLVCGAVGVAQRNRLGWVAVAVSIACSAVAVLVVTALRD